MESLVVPVKLICAHLCADFIFQPDCINEGKRKSGLTGIGYQILHSAIHALAAYLFVADWTCLLIPSVIFASHFVIDFIKCRSKDCSLRIFLIDQFCHLAVIGILWYVLFCESADLLSYLSGLCSLRIWILATAYILMLKPSSILLNLFLRKWVPPASSNGQSLPNAGQWIGYIERILILTFILIDSIEGVGFLLAAKSVFRFGELSKAKEIRTTEYVLIGTLASFTIAILVGIVVSRWLFLGTVW